MDTMKRILLISVLVGLLVGANSANADLGLQLTPVAGAPAGYRTYDIEATTTTELGVMELVFDASEPASIYQVGSPSPIEASGGTYDTYLSMPVNWQVFGSAVDINSDPEAWGGQNLNKTWNPQTGQHSGSGTFQVGRVTLANWASADYTIMGWEGGQTGAGTPLTGTLDIAQMGLSVVPGTGSGISGYDRYYDFYADVSTDLGAMELLFNTSATGGIYRVSAPGVNDPNNADPYESYVSTGYGTPAEQTTNTVLFGAAVDITGTSGIQTLTNKDIDLTWVPSAGTLTSHGQYHVGRVTVGNLAGGSWTLKGWQTGGYDAVTISGSFPEIPMELSVVEGTGSGISGYDRYLDFYADVSSNLGAMELLLNTDSAGDIYQNSSLANDPNDADPYDSYVSIGYPTDGEQPGNTVLFGAAVDIAGTSGVQAFTDEDIDLTWVPSAGIQTGEGLFHVGRVTLADSATGSWILKGWQSGGSGDVSISGDIIAASLLPGDVDGNGYVSGPDLTYIITNWGMTGATRAQGDLSGDGTVAGADYTEVITYWGTGTPPPEPGSIPEPATIGLFLLTGTMLLARRRRQSANDGART